MALSEKEKKEVVDKFVRMTAKATMQLFYMLGLETHIEAMVINEETDEEFIFSFKKVKK